MKNITLDQLESFDLLSTDFHYIFDHEDMTAILMPFPSACRELFQGHSHAWGLLPDRKFMSANSYGSDGLCEMEGSIESMECGESMGEVYEVILSDGSHLNDLVSAKWGGYEDFIDDAVREEFGADCADALLRLLGS